MRQKINTYTDDPDYKVEKIANLDHFPHIKGYDFNKNNKLHYLNPPLILHFFYVLP